MEIEENRRPQSSGSEIHHGAHVCHRCGWAYPNPHPSAKQRRSHKKHCGKTGGGDGGGGDGENKISDEEIYDEGQSGKLEEPIAEVLRVEGEEDKNGSVGSGGSVANFCKGNTMEPSNLPHGTHVQGPDIEGVADKLKNDTHLEYHADATMEHKESYGSLLTKAFFLDGCEVKTERYSAQNVVDSSMIVSDAYVGNCAENSTVVLAAPNLPGDPPSESSVTNSELHNIHDSAEIDALSDHTIAIGTLTNGFPEEVSAPIKELESITYPVEFSACEHLDAFVDSSQLDYQSDMTGNCKVKGNEDENLHALPMPSSTDLDKTSEMNDIVEDNGSESNVSLIYSAVEAGKVTEYHPEDEVPELIQKELVMVKSDRNANGISSIMEIQENDPFHVETENRASMSKITDHLSTENGHDNGERPPFVTDFECEPEVSAEDFEVSEGLGSDGNEAHPYATIGGSFGAECARQEANLYLSHEGMSGDHMVVSNGGSIALFDVSISNEGTKVVNGSQLVIPVEAQINDSDVIEDCRQEICKVDSSQSDTEINHKSRIDVSESKPPPDEDIGINSSSLENLSQHYSDQRDHQKVHQERFTEPAVDSDTDYTITKREVKIECMETESSLGKEPHEELDHEKVHMDHLVSIPGSHLDELDQQKGLHDKLIEPDVGNKNDQRVTGTEVQIEHFETESSLSTLLCEESNLNESTEVHLCLQDVEILTLEQHLNSSPDTQACIQGSVILHNSEANNIPEGVASGICDQSLQEKGIDVVSEKQPDATLGAADTSVDSNNQTDNLDGQQGFVSDGAVGFTRDAADGLPTPDAGAPMHTNTQTPKDQPGEKSADDIEDLFEAPSFMTLVETGNEIQSVQNLQHEFSESKRNEEITEKPRVPLKNLLMEANLESKQKAANGAQHHNMSPNKKGRLSTQTSQTSSEISSESSFNRGDHKEWNSPARLPNSKNEKRRVKGRQSWVPFICCPSID